MPMADCISERRSNTRGWAASAATLAILTGVVSGAGSSSTSTKTSPAKTTPAKATSAKTSPSTAGKVTSVRFWSLGDVTRVSIEVSSEFKVYSERLSEPDRLFFDIQGARPAMLEKSMHVIAVGDALLKQIRIAETQPGVTRVVLDLEAHDPRVEFTASQLANPERLMVELKLKEKPAPPVTGSVSGARILSSQAALNTLTPDLETALAPEPSTKPAPLAKPAPRQFRPPPEDFSIAAPKPAREEPKLEILTPPPALGMVASAKPAPAPVAARVVFPPPPLPAPSAPPPIQVSLPPPGPPTAGKLPPEPLPAKANANGERSLTRALGLKLGRVVIDAGHGGHDVGTRGPSGLLEKDVVLDVALKLGSLLEERLGTEVVYTRSDDTYIALEQRTQIANDHKADLFLSIHANSSPYPTVGGVEAYYLNFTTSKAALDLAAKENASAQSSIFDLRAVLAKIAMKDKIDESREFAATVQTSLFAFSSKNNAAAKNRGIKRAPFVVLIGASMPSVLAEIGFLTNATDEALLKKPEQREKIAEALYKGIASYADSLSHFQVAKRD
jgi:N-acetylmuramoyl-L-alanine amidase